MFHGWGAKGGAMYINRESVRVGVKFASDNILILYKIIEKYTKDIQSHPLLEKNISNLMIHVAAIV